jgi:hypothetical protein
MVGYSFWSEERFHEWAGEPPGRGGQARISRRFFVAWIAAEAASLETSKKNSDKEEKGRRAVMPPRVLFLYN